MSQTVEAPGNGPDTEDLRSALERALSRHFGVPRLVTRLMRRPADNRSSFALEELDLCLNDGAALSLLFKNLGRHALLESARHVKPAFLFNPLREIEAYRRFLATDRMGTAVCFGAEVDAPSGRYWLFLEKVPGVELYQVGDFATWQHVARYLAARHSCFAADRDLLARARSAHLLMYDADYFRTWLDRAQEFVAVETLSPQQNGRHFLERLASRYEQVIERLVALPVTLIHGEFYASNVLVEENAQGQRVCPVDWEMAGVGPGLIDLAALTAGNWTDEQRTALALAYHAGLPPDHGLSLPPDALLAALDYCHLHLAIQWLGWSSEWSPPPDHRRDWLSEAMRLTEKLGL